MNVIRINTPDIQPFEVKHTMEMRKLAPECMVLLKNDGTLPLAPVKDIALYGSGARKTIKGGTGSGDVNVRHFVTVEEGLENAGFAITTKNWLDAYDEIKQQNAAAFFAALEKEAEELGIPTFVATMGKNPPEPNYTLPHNGTGDTAVYVLARNSGEGSDRLPEAGDINLTETEIRDILQLNSQYEHFVLVLNVGGLIDLTPVKEVPAILLMGQLGTATGDALADVLFGKSYPSGKLTMTWAPIEQYPSTEGFGHPDDTYYKEGVYVGYRYFDTCGMVPDYPFGYGMGYTTFTTEVIDFTADAKKASVVVKVTNTGKCIGKEVVQVYTSAPEGEIDKPYQELAAFAKTEALLPGDAQEIILSFDINAMASYCEQCAAYVMEKGNYIVRVGNSSRDTKIAGVITLDETTAVEKVRNIAGDPGFSDLKPAKTGLTYEDEAAELETAKVASIKGCDLCRKDISYAEVMPEIPEGETVRWEEVKAGTKTLDEFVAGLSVEDMVYLTIGSFNEKAKTLLEVVGNASTTVAGAAGETTHKLEKYGVPVLVMADGPAGVRVSPIYAMDGDKAVSIASSFGDGVEINNSTNAYDNLEKLYQYCTAIPIGTELAQSWNVELVEKCGDIVGEEMEMFGTHLWLAPAMNIYRSPLCGRNFEYFSEDPLISGCIAAGITKGVQAHEGCATTIKHYAGNNQETNRYFSNSHVSERALREIYLKGFEICVKASQPHFVMTSYNLINGEHACSLKDIQTYTLRDEWGFEGVVMTDWLVTGGMGPKGAVWECASAAGTVKSGNDIVMPGMPSDKADILAAFENKDHKYPLSKAELQTAAKRILGMILKLA